ncbi:hypothetical protein CVT26_003924 [Gymnopilus dilepis]|uniref:Uncharacterized protein n=1 Tax=Gymnopilus dilepis TaxID=231916 RepID=A0A409YUW9_9AGAR|nr:hypothetical protein CVT26_003924 [Gymnopilus dilepis]
MYEWRKNTPRGGKRTSFAFQKESEHKKDNKGAAARVDAGCTLSVNLQNFAGHSIRHELEILQAMSNQPIIEESEASVPII